MSSNITLKAKTECSICLDDFEAQTVVAKRAYFTFSGSEALTDSMEPVAASCNHVFHQSCLKRWIEEFKTKTEQPPCPKCRTPLTEQPAVVLQRNQPRQQNLNFQAFTGEVEAGRVLLLQTVLRLRQVHEQGVDLVFFDTPPEVHFQLTPDEVVGNAGVQQEMEAEVEVQREAEFDIDNDLYG